MCGEWGTYVEEVIGERRMAKGESRRVGDSNPMRLQEVVATEEMRIDMHNGELNRVLGGGLVPRRMHSWATASRPSIW